MKVLQLKIKNFKCLEDLQATPNGSNVWLIAGNNKGKSSVIDAVYAAVSPEKLPLNPVMNGKTNGQIEVTIGDDNQKYNVLLKFSNENPKGTLTLTNSEGHKISSPATMLEQLCGKISFDPFEFFRMSEDKQVKFVKELLHLNFDDIDAEIKRITEERKAINADIKAIDGSIERKEIKEHELIHFKEPKPIEELEKQIKDAGEFIEKRSEKSAQVETLTKRIADGDKVIRECELELKTKEYFISQCEASFPHIGKIDEVAKAAADLLPGKEIFKKILGNVFDLKINVEDLIKGVENLKKSIGHYRDIQSGLKTEKETLEKWLLDNPKIEMEELNEKYQTILKFNNKVKEVQGILSEVQLRDDKKAMSLQYSAQLDSLKEEKLKRIAAVDMPVEGLGIEEDMLTLNSLPFAANQINKAGIIEAGIKIMMAANPGLKICRIKDGALLDKETMHNLITYVNENGYQAFVEYVNHDGGELKVEMVEV